MDRDGRCNKGVKWEEGGGSGWKEREREDGRKKRRGENQIKEGDKKMRERDGWKVRRDRVKETKLN